MPKKYHDIIHQVISHKSHYVTAERMLLIILIDKRYIINLAVFQIIKTREIVPYGSCVSRFIIPVLKLGAAEYIDFIDWQGCYVTLPPVCLEINSRISEDDKGWCGNGHLGLLYYTQKQLNKL